MMQGLVPSLFNAALHAGLGALLLYAGIAKRRHYVRWWQALGHYKVLPAALKRPLAETLPWLEIGLGIWLCLPLASAASSLAALLLFLGFALAVGANWAAGVHRFDCGCQFGAPREHASLVLVRALALAAVAGLGNVLPSVPPVAALLAGLATGLALLLWGSWRQLGRLPRLTPSVVSD
jgi:hypothetical protein